MDGHGCTDEELNWDATDARMNRYAKFKMDTD